MQLTALTPRTTTSAACSCCRSSPARDLTAVLIEALIVNPYDLHQASDALAAALRITVEELRERMRAMRRLVAEFNVYRWAGRMLVDAASLRRKERMFGRLSSSNGAHT